MTGDLGAFGEGMGDLASGAVMARAVEPDTGGTQGADGHTGESACLNCGTRLVGPHCHACGQRAHVHRTLAAFGHDLLHGVLHFEGKTWRTLPLLAFKPGKLTREYIDGRRASYVSPIALFLFAVFAMFAVFHLTQDHETGAPDIAEAPAAAIAKSEKELAALEQRRDAAATPEERAELDETIASTREGLAGLKDITEAGDDVGSDVQRELGDVPVVGGVIDAARSNPELFAYKMQTYAYKYSWALIPISVPFVWLLFPFSRRFRFYDHTVFVTYSLCFMSMLAVAWMLFDAAGLASMAGILTLVPPLHMYKQLRGTYGVGRFGATWRTFALTIFASTALLIFFALISAQTG